VGLRVLVDILNFIQLSRVYHLSKINNEFLDHIRHAILSILGSTSIASVSFIFSIKPWIPGWLIGIGFILVLQMKKFLMIGTEHVVIIVHLHPQILRHTSFRSFNTDSY
jgi:hypothetical protein